MATYKEAERARDYFADKYLDGVRVHAVGINKTEDGYGVGITASDSFPLDFAPETLGVPLTWRVSGRAEALQQVALDEQAQAQYDSDATVQALMAQAAASPGEA